MTGNVDPDTVNPAPETVAALMVTGTEPVEVRVIDCVTGVLSGTSPNDSFVGLMLRVGVPATAPLPLRLTTAAGAFETLVVTDNSPCASPEATGTNSTVILMVLPAASVNGRLL